MHPDGLGWLWVPSGLKDGPLADPLRAPRVAGATTRSTRGSGEPRRDTNARADNPYASSPDARFPYVLTTYRLTEHHTAGGMSRYLTHLAELQPELFGEISPELARETGLDHGGWVTITTPRSAIEARVLVTARVPTAHRGRPTVHQVGPCRSTGAAGGLVKGDVVNDLLALSEEPNVRIMESKALLCHVAPGRRERA